MSFVVIDQLYKKFGEVTALNNVNLEIKQGEFFALLGPSGCGKTTTMRCVAGFEEITSGDIFIDQQNVNTIPANRRSCGMVFQSYALFPHMTVFENVAYSLQVNQFNEGGIGRKFAVLARLLNKRLGKVPKSIEEKVYNMLEFVELEKFSNRLIGQLSGGQQQRVALARALIMEPSVLLMDEPLSNLDKRLRGHMRNTIIDIQKKIGITTIFVTHDQEEAMSMADRVAVMFDGQVAQVDQPTALYNQPVTRQVADFVGSSNILNGTVKESNDPQKHTVIQICENQILKSTTATDKKDVEVLLRPENIKLYREDQKSNEQNTLFGKISVATFLGSMIRYIVEVGSLDIIVDTVFEKDSDLIGEGENVQLVIDPDQVILL